MSKTNPLEMSDEDFLQQNGPTEEEAPASSDDKSVIEDKPETEAAVVEETVVESPADTTEVVEGEEKSEVTQTEDKPEDKPAEGEATTETDDAAATAAAGKVNGEAATEDKPALEKKPTMEEKVLPDVTVLGDFYNKIMTPFKANGKTIELKSPEEAISLMQMGANYTRKMQEIVPHRRVLTMLQNNNLLDEAKLSYLIDLDKKNPDAVKKLIKDSGLDPVDIDLDKAEDYVAGDHTVSNEEVEFRTTLNALADNEAGKATLHTINTQWDEQSKEILWSKPEVMTRIHEQREQGVYDIITAEVERRKTLGMIDPKIPFLQAYTETGDEMAKAALEASGQTAEVEQPVKTELVPVATRTATPKSKVANGDKAAAASPTRSTPASAKANVNVLAMSDEEFVKINSLRV